MHRDENLLFGVFAVQLGKISPQQLAAAAGAWATDPSSNLSDRLIKEGSLTETDRNLIGGFVRQAIEAHGNDPAATLSAFGGQEKVYQSFAASLVPTSSGGVRTVDSPKDVEEVLSDQTISGVLESPGRYTLRSEYARGGMGRVLLVHDEHLGREIALKELLPEIARHSSDSDTGTPVRKSMPMIARFLQEAKITGQLEHPSIVPVYELGTRADGSIYYTMKLVRGKTLSQAIREAANLTERLFLLSHFIDLCNAIAYAHSRGVIHRDLKPSNVMVGEFGETVVLDWGLAKSKSKFDAHSDGYAETIRVMNMGDETEFAKTQFGQALGTPVYMPPEQAVGDLDHIDERSDIYSLGAVLYEILACMVPFDGLSLQHILNQVLNEAPTPISEFASGVPEELTSICSKAMSKKPEDRYVSVGELVNDIKQYQAGERVSAHHYSALDKAQRFLARHSREAIFATGAIVMTMIIAFFAVSANQQGEIARERQKMAEMLRYGQAIRSAAASIDSNSKAEALGWLSRAPESERQWEWKYLYNQVAQTEWKVEFETAIMASHLSEFGDRVFVGTENGEIYVTSEATSEHQRICEVNFFVRNIWTVEENNSILVADAGSFQKINTEDGAIEMSFGQMSSPSGGQLVYLDVDYCRDSSLLASSAGRTVGLWDASSGESLANIGVDFSVDALQLSEDGSTLLVVSSGETNSRAQLLDIEAETISAESQYAGRILASKISPDGKHAALLVAEPTEKGNQSVRLELLGSSPDISTISLSIPIDKESPFAFTGDGTTLVIGRTDGAMSLVELDASGDIRTIAAHLGPVREILHGIGETEFVSIDEAGTLIGWSDQFGHRVFDSKVINDFVNVRNEVVDNVIVNQSGPSSLAVIKLPYGDSRLAFVGKVIDSWTNAEESSGFLLIQDDSNNLLVQSTTADEPAKSVLELGFEVLSGEVSANGNAVALEGGDKLAVVDLEERRLVWDAPQQGLDDYWLSPSSSYLAIRKLDGGRQVFDIHLNSDVTPDVSVIDFESVAGTPFGGWDFASKPFSPEEEYVLLMTRPADSISDTWSYFYPISIVWDLKNNRVHGTILGYKPRGVQILDGAFVGDENSFLTLHSDGAFLWDANSLTLQSSGSPDFNGSDYKILDVNMSTGEYLAGSTSSFAVGNWNGDNLPLEVALIRDRIERGFFARGHRVILWHPNQSSSVWSANTGAELLRFEDKQRVPLREGSEFYLNSGVGSVEGIDVD